MKEKIKMEVVTVRNEVVEKLAALSTAAFGLVAALAWNDAIKALFAEGGPLYLIAGAGPWLYAIAVTLLAVIITIWIGRISKKAKKDEKAAVEEQS